MRWSNITNIINKKSLQIIHTDHHLSKNKGIIKYLCDQEYIILRTHTLTTHHQDPNQSRIWSRAQWIGVHCFLRNVCLLNIVPKLISFRKGIELVLALNKCLFYHVCSPKVLGGKIMLKWTTGCSFFHVALNTSLEKTLWKWNKQTLLWEHFAHWFDSGKSEAWLSTGQSWPPGWENQHSSAIPWATPQLLYYLQRVTTNDKKKVTIFVMFKEFSQATCLLLWLLNTTYFTLFT